MILYECLNGFVVGESETGVQLGSGMIAVFGTLPEESFVIAHEGCRLHLRLMPEDGVPFMPQFFR